MGTKQGPGDPVEERPSRQTTSRFSPQIRRLTETVWLRHTAAEAKLNQHLHLRW